MQLAISIVWISCAAFALLGGAFVAVWGLRALRSSGGPPDSSERLMLFGALVAAIAVLPLLTEVRVPADEAIVTIHEHGYSRTFSHTLVREYGGLAILIFTLPVLIVAFPLGLWTSRWRPLAAASAGLLVAAPGLLFFLPWQESLLPKAVRAYGILFAPSAALLVYAAFIGVRRTCAQQVAAADA